MTQLSAEAAQGLQVEPILEDYAEAPITEAFDWKNIIRSAREHRELNQDDPLYLVVFRSHLKEGIDTSPLLEHDTNAHAAALESPHLIHYFADEPDALGKAVSFCLWENPEAARAASRDPRHAAAAKMITFYQSYSLERYDVHIDDQDVSLVLRT